MTMPMLKAKCFYLLILGMIIVIMVGYQQIVKPRTLKDNFNCSSKVLHVMFLKTHKTGGSSVQNMLMRFGNSRNLTFVLPRNGNYLGYPKLFQTSMAMQLKENLKYNIFTHHTRYNRSEISKIMPANSKYITLLRNPVTLFESLYSYYHLGSSLKMTLDEFVEIDIVSNKMSDVRNRRVVYNRIGRNQMSFDLGMDIEDFDNPIQTLILAEQLNSDFDLVMIAERLPESLILLKHLLCWSTFDIIIFHHNSRQNQFKKIITDELEMGIQYWNAADKYLYDYFYAILEEKIENFGIDKMNEEVIELQDATDYWYEYCVTAELDKKNLTGSNRVYSPQVLGFQIKHEDDKICQDLTKAELQFTDELRKKLKTYAVLNLT
ncbi:hypothetical protein CHUAL_013673 [Chamberlinius hualienensis]